MLKLRVEILTAALLLTLSGAGACDAQKRGAKGGASKPVAERPRDEQKPAATPAPERGGEGTLNDELMTEGDVQRGGDLKTLAEGSYGSVSDAFVAVVRDPESYAALREVVKNLPEMNGDFFRRGAVVAAFLGVRRSGGYGVQVTRADEGALRVAETTPPKGAMTTMALTMPFKVVSVGLNEQRSLAVELGDAWKNALRPYRVSGEFTASGGFAGRMEKFKLEGELHVARLAKLISVAFALRSAGARQPLTLETVATGTANSDNFTLPRLNAGSLVEWPNGGLRAVGRFEANEDRLSLTFEPLPINYSDSFSGTGQLQATATAPPKKKTAPDADLPM